MIKIHKSTAKKTLRQFFVTMYGKNGEPLNHSECFKRKAGAIKNIKAVAKNFGVETLIAAIDCTGKTEKTILI